MRSCRHRCEQCFTEYAGRWMQQVFKMRVRASTRSYEDSCLASMRLNDVAYLWAMFQNVRFNLQDTSP